jgi:hypothetical protein
MKEKRQQKNERKLFFFLGVVSAQGSFFDALTIFLVVRNLTRLKTVLTNATVFVEQKVGLGHVAFFACLDHKYFLR